MTARHRSVAVLLAVAFLGLTLQPALAQFIRSQTDRITSAIQNQIRQAIRPHLTVRNPAGQVVSLAISPDNRLLLIALQDHSLRLWDLQTGTEQNRIDAGSDPVSVSRISADDRRVVIGTAGGAIAVFDAASGAELRRFPSNGGGIAALDVSRDASVIAAAGRDGSVRLWDGATGRPRAALTGTSAAVTDLALSADGTRVAAGGSDGSLRVWQVGTATPAAVFSTAGAVVALGFTADGRIVSTSANGTVERWAVNAAAPQVNFRAASAAASAQISADGRTVAVTDADSHASVVDVDSGRVLRELSGPAGSSRYVVVDVNQRRILTGGADGEVRVWDIASGADLAQIISTLNGWAVVDGQGRFDGSQQGVSDVRWTANQADLKIDDFSDNYYEPGLLAKRMSGQAAFVSSAPTAVADGITLPPRLTIAVPPGAFAAGQAIEVTVTALDQGGGVMAPRLFDNGKLVSPDSVVSERNETQNGAAAIVRTYRLQLVAAENRLDAVAANQQRIDSEPVSATVTASGQPPLPNLHILTIGINKYRDARYDLDYGVPDAVAMLKQMSRATEGVFGRVISYQLLDQSATRAKILEVLAAFRALPPDDILVLYIASHGEVVGNDWYMLPYDVDFSSEASIAQTGVSATMLRDALSRVGAQRVLIMIDSCKSGSSIETLAAAMDRKVLRSVSRDTGIAILAATRKDQLAAEIPKLGHGAFTYVVLQALAGKADRDPKDGRITARKLLSYSAQALPSLTRSLADYTQVPVAYDRGEDFLLRVAAQ